MSKNIAARYEIAIDGAIFLKTKQPVAKVTVRDVVTGETIAVKHLLTK
jgi:hypothetical protein